MRILTNRKIIFLLLAAAAVAVITPIVYSHCQLPCGIYDDNMRFNMMAENITTIEKSMNMINQLSAEQKPNMNQIVRWVQNKDNHSDELSHTITYYFMAQRIAPAEKTDAQAYEKYLTKLTLLHKMLVSSMKAKQTTDLTITKQLTELLADFKKAYYEGSEQKHEH
jgi:nickel superoxide dismutase